MFFFFFVYFGLHAVVISTLDVANTGYFRLQAPAISNQNNFRNYFNAITHNDTNRTLEFKEVILKSNEENAQAFNEMKSDMALNKYKNNQKMNEFNHTSELHNVTKREPNDLFDEKGFLTDLEEDLKRIIICEDKVAELRIRLVRAERDKVHLTALVGKMNSEKGTVENKARFYKMLMGMSNRVDVLLNLLWPRDIPRPNSRFYQLMFLFVIGNGNYYIQQLRELINQCGMNFEQFSIYLQNVYRDDANQPVHTIKVPPCTPAEIEGACAAAKFELGDDMTKPILPLLRVLFCKLNQTKAPDGKILIPTNEADNRYRCLVLANVPYELREEKKREGETENPQKPKPEDLLDQSIEKKLRTQFFERYITEKKLIERIERLDKPVIKEGSLPNRRSFLIKFYNVHDALDAFLKHMTKPFAEEKRIGISVRNCNNLYTDNLDEIIRPRPPIPKTVSDPESPDWSNLYFYRIL